MFYTYHLKVYIKTVLNVLYHITIKDLPGAGFDEVYRYMKFIADHRGGSPERTGRCVLFRVNLIGLVYLIKNNIAVNFPVVKCSLPNAKSIRGHVCFAIVVIKEIHNG